MSASTLNSSHEPRVHISYECITRERLRESTTYLYEVACSITHLAPSAHISIRVTGEHTYRSTIGRDVAFTRSEVGAAAYIELMEAEQLEVRIVELEGTYCKATYQAHGRELTEHNTRRILSTVQSLDPMRVSD